jgi:hypothetical protein
MLGTRRWRRAVAMLDTGHWAAVYPVAVCPAALPGQCAGVTPRRMCGEN